MSLGTPFESVPHSVAEPELTGGGGTTVTLALEDTVGSARLAAVTVMLVLLDTTGAVSRPVEETLPLVADQDTPVLLVPCTEALNCCAPPELNVAVLGVMAMVTAVVGVLGFTLTAALA